MMEFDMLYSSVKIGEGVCVMNEGEKFLYAEETYAIRGAAFEVYQTSIASGKSLSS